MAENRYLQYCGAARALDIVGDRWTLLIVRELRFGPRRFTDLLDGLPGMSRNLLAQRLRALERDGVLARSELPPPAARQVYELTEDGRDLAEAMLPLVAWGARRLGARRPADSFRAHWAALAMEAFADREAARGISGTFEFRIGESAFHFRIEDGDIELRDGPAEQPTAVVTTDEATWSDIASGATTAQEAAARGTFAVSGDRQAMRRVGQIFSRNSVLAGAEALVSGTGREQ